MTHHEEKLTGENERSTLVVLAGIHFRPAEITQITAALERKPSFQEASSLSEIMGLLASGEVAAVVLDAENSPIVPEILLANVDAYLSSIRARIIVLKWLPQDPAPRSLNLFYQSAVELPTTQLANLLASATAEFERAGSFERIVSGHFENCEAQLLQIERGLAETAEIDDLGATGLSLLQLSFSADCHQLFLVEADRGFRRYVEPAGPESSEEFIPRGLAGLLIRCPRFEQLSQAETEPLYDAAADNPSDLESPTLLMGSLPKVDGSFLVGAILARDKGRSPFSEDDRERLRRILEYLSTFCGRLLSNQSLIAEEEGDSAASIGSAVDIFRGTAVEHAGQPTDSHGKALAGTGSGLDRTFALLLISILPLILAALLFVEIHEQASGPALVVLGGRSDVTAQSSGVVAEVFVKPGQAVEAGEALLRSQSAGSREELEFLIGEHRKRLRALLLDPTDIVAKSGASDMRSRLSAARRELELSTIRAPHGGEISDIRIDEGRFFQPGSVLVTLKAASESPAAIAALPGRYRPLIRQGTDMKLKLDGFPKFTLELPIQRLDNELMSVEEVSRRLGIQLDASIESEEPVFLVYADLPDQFEDDEEVFAFHRGMKGQVDIKLRARTLLSELLHGSGHG